MGSAPWQHFSCKASMSSGTLYTYPENFRAYKGLIAAKYSGANVTVDPNFVFGETNKNEDFLKKFPLGKVPAFQANDGTCITESNAIAYYLGNGQLRGSDDLSRAQILQWLSFADSEILPASCTWVFPCLGIMPFNKQSTERAKEDVKKVLSTLNSHLLTKTYLVGERITLADICVCCTLLHLYEHVLEPSFRQEYRNTNRWFNTMINQPEVKAVIGEFKLCEKMAQFDGKKFAEMQAKMSGGGGDSKKQDKKKKDEKKKDDKKKETPKKKEPEPADEEMEDPPLAKEEKPNDPFAPFPKGKFDFDDFKRCYSNEDESKSIPYFWEKLDKEAYSIWRCDYKYPEELTQVFMSCNLIGGMMQRLEKLRKNAFASMLLFGENNNSSISGIWVWRGPELAFTLCPDWQIDYESYEWKKLDIDAPETKEMVNHYFAWTGTDSAGRAVNQGKIFK